MTLYFVLQQSSTPYNRVSVNKEELRVEYEAVLSVERNCRVTEVLDLGTSAAIIKH